MQLLDMCSSHWGHWWHRLQPTSSVIRDTKSVDTNLVDFDNKLCIFQFGFLYKFSSWPSLSLTGKTSANVLYIKRYDPLKIGTDDVGSSQWWRRLHDWADVIHADFQMVISRYLQNISTYLFCTAECQELCLFKIPGWSRYVFQSKLTRFESTDFASVMIDDIDCSRRHQYPQCVPGIG